MNDERVKQGFLQIRAELCTIMYFAALISFVVKALVFGLTVSNCVLEFVLLVGTPIYQLIRQRQLDLTTYEFFQGKNYKRRMAITVLVVPAVYSLVLYLHRQGGQVEEGIGGFSALAAFVAVFCLMRWIYYRYEKKRKEDLDHRYDDEDQ